MKWCPNTLPTNRVSCVVSNKISKKAVVRNRIKRRLREASRIVILSSTPSKEQNADVILIAKKEIVNASFRDIVATLRSLWERNKKNHHL